MIDTYSQDNRRSLYTFATLFLLSVVVRIITAEYIDIGGDNSEKWRQTHHLIEGLGYTHWYQQTVRWGIMLPLAGIMKTFGLNPVFTYIQPLFYSSLAAGFLYLIGEKLQSQSLGIATALAAILFPQMAQTGSQLWPGVFELGYLTVCVWLILTWIDTRSTTTLVLAAMLFFLGWGCRVTMIYAAPGLALLIWLPTRDFKSLLLCIGIFGGLCLVEWAAFWNITGNPMGRIGILAGTHIQTAGLDISFTDYLLNIKKIVKLKGLIAIWVLCLIGCLRTAFTGEPRWKGIAVLYLTYALLLLYMISSISPLKLAMPVGTRFWGVIAPFGLLVLFKNLFDLKQTFPKTGKTFIAIIFLVFIAFTLKKVPNNNSLIQVNQDYALLTPVLAAGHPVLMHYEHWQPNFIEDYIIYKITGKKGKRAPRKDHATVATIRNHARMIALFVEDVEKHEAYLDKRTLNFTTDTICLFVPPETDKNVLPTVEVRFGRKHHVADFINGNTTQ
ncbi:glycosyltransferase family 39 protein [Pseudodesulfovibrio sp.]|nr:glycosyltransferase family 39 protein [Pseudodesulfovibrio sp.]